MNVLDKIAGRGLIVSEAIAAEFMTRLGRELRLNDLQNPSTLLNKAQRVLTQLVPAFAAANSTAQLAAWVMGQKQIADKLPDHAKRKLASMMPPRDPPGAGLLLTEGPPVIRFPKIEAAARSLQTRGIMHPTDFYNAAQSIRANAFTMSGKVTGEILARVREVLAEQVEHGASLADFRRAMVGDLEKSTLGPAHLETVFRTNVQSAYSDGHEVIANNPVVAAVFPYQEYFATHDARVRPEHLALEKLGLDGTGIYRRDDPVWDLFTPPWGFNCFPAGAVVAGNFNMAYRSWYDGELIEITTRSGNRLTVTKNHPVMTDEGFAAAHTLRNRGYVLRYERGNQWRFPPDENEHYKPAPIEQVFRAFCDSGTMARLPIGPDDFHGDAARGNGYVDTVRAARKLLIYDEADLAQCVGDELFAAMNSALPGMAGFSAQRAFGRANGSPSGGFPSRAALLDDFGAAALDGFPFGELRFGAAARLDASRYEVATDNPATNAEFARELILGHSESVFLDQIIDIRKIDFSGHVYDLQSPKGWLVANGVLCSNCRCTVNLMTIKDAANAGVKEAQRWLRTGIEPSPPEWRISAIPFRPPQGFGGRRKMVAA